MNHLRFSKVNARWLLAGLPLTVLLGFGQTSYIAQFSTQIRTTFSLRHLVGWSALGPGVTGWLIDWVLGLSSNGG